MTHEEGLIVEFSGIDGKKIPEKDFHEILASIAEAQNYGTRGGTLIAPHMARIYRIDRMNNDPDNANFKVTLLAEDPIRAFDK